MNTISKLYQLLDNKRVVEVQGCTKTYLVTRSWLYSELKIDQPVHRQIEEVAQKITQWA